MITGCPLSDRSGELLPLPRYLSIWGTIIAGVSRVRAAPANRIIIIDQQSRDPAIGFCVRSASIGIEAALTAPNVLRIPLLPLGTPQLANRRQGGGYGGWKKYSGAVKAAGDEDDNALQRWGSRTGKGVLHSFSRVTH